MCTSMAQLKSLKSRKMMSGEFSISLRVAEVIPSMDRKLMVAVAGPYIKDLPNCWESFCVVKTHLFFRWKNEEN